MRHDALASGLLPSEEEGKPRRALKAYSKQKASPTCIFTDYSPDEIFKCLKDKLDKDNVEYSEKRAAWRINYAKKIAFSLEDEDL